MCLSCKGFSRRQMFKAGLALSALATTRPAFAQSHMMMLRDGEAEAFVATMLAPLTQTAQVSPGLLKVRIVQHSSINAFVAEDHQLFLHSGMFVTLHTCAQFAGILAHEMGHVASQHLSRLPEEMRKTSLQTMLTMAGAVGLGAIGGGSAAAGLALGGQASAFRQLMSFTQSQEHAADTAALRYLDTLGWPKSGLQEVLQRFKDQELPSRPEAYARTHPLSHDRLEMVKHHQGRSMQGQMPTALEEDWQFVKARAKGWLEAPNHRLPEQGPDLYTKAISYQRTGESAMAFSSFERLIAQYPKKPWIQEAYATALLQAGNIDKSIVWAARAYEALPQHVMAGSTYAQALMAKEETTSTQRAERILRQMLQRERDNPSFWRELSRAQGRLGQLPQAQLSLAEEALLQRRTEDMKRFARRAKDTAQDRPTQIRAQDLLQL